MHNAFKHALVFLNRIRVVSCLDEEKVTSLRGLTLIVGISLMSLCAIVGGQAIVRSGQAKLNPDFSQEDLWKIYRRSIDPHQRREAALLLASKSRDSPLRLQRLLNAQGWGDSSLAAVALKLQAQNAERVLGFKRSIPIWEDLLRRFPLSISSTDAYYSLGRKRPKLREYLLKNYPAHPAALASALELNNQGGDSYQGALHLARWGSRWPGAEQAIRDACRSTLPNGFESKEIEALAFSLAKLGDGKAALECLKDESSRPSILLAIGKALLQGNSFDQEKGEELLMKMVQKNPQTPESLEVARLFSSPFYPRRESFKLLPESLSTYSPSVLAAKIRLNEGNDFEVLIKGWEDYADIWELQWYLARKALLNSDWIKATSILQSIASSKLPEPLAVRQKFWLAFSAAKQGQTFQAKKIWKEISIKHPPGYYTWRASSRIEKIDFPKLKNSDFLLENPKPLAWQPLGSKNNLANLLWRLGLEKDAWETWRSSKGQDLIGLDSFEETLIEGRLRMSVGDNWLGLNKLWKVSLISVIEDCFDRQLLHRSQYPYRFWSEISEASKVTGILPELLLSIVKQESRFSPGVESIAGAIGLMQIMPETANQYSQDVLSKDALKETRKNILLGALHLSKLIDRWNMNPWLVIASYNAGSEAVSRWESDELEFEPELWVERIPYPETRFYTKKVLGNIWSYLKLDDQLCQEHE